MNMSNRDRFILWFLPPLAVLIVWAAWHYDARGAELVIPEKFRDRVYESGDLNKFGRYGDAYYLRRWKRMCNGPARYDAMREANDLGKGNPC